MLTTLRIKNLALVPDLTLELQPGFNVITGETGAGKSIIIGALNLVLGERADRTLIRSGADACVVEAVFDLGGMRAPLAPFLEENGLEPCEQNQLVLKRTFSSSGTNRQFINASPTTLQTLAALGEWLVDMHGPHDHQSLLHPARQLAILDAFGGLGAARESFARLVETSRALEAEKAALIVDEQTYAQQIDLLRFQVREISGAALEPREEEQLTEQYHRAANAAKLLQLAQQAAAELTEDDFALVNQAGRLGRTLQEIQRLDRSAAELIGLHEQLMATARDLQETLSRYAERLELDPKLLQQLEDRLNTVQSLKRKYGPTLADVVAFGAKSARKLEALEQRDGEVARLNAALETTRAELKIAGGKLSAQRRKIIPKLSRAVTAQLRELGFRQSHFEIDLQSDPHTSDGKLRSSGFDELEFLFAPNPGEPARPLRVIASSGEMARVMLALKTVLAGQDDVPVLIFDEIDANVGGETAGVVGEKMRRIARERQVVCITHLPAVAAAASAHYVVTKEIEKNRTISKIELLPQTERVLEVARMLGGPTEASRKHAEALLKEFRRKIVP
jgi:DNA repair protein RecN (Recombination protein N)